MFRKGHLVKAELTDSLFWECCHELGRGDQYFLVPGKTKKKGENFH